MSDGPIPIQSAGAIRLSRVREFCNWLDTMPAGLPFQDDPGFAQFADLSDREIREAAREMQERSRATQARIDTLETQLLGEGVHVVDFSPAARKRRPMLRDETNQFTDDLSDQIDSVVERSKLNESEAVACVGAVAFSWLLDRMRARIDGEANELDVLELMAGIAKISSRPPGPKSAA